MAPYHINRPCAILSVQQAIPHKGGAHLQPLKTVAHICSHFPTKFGIPRQSGLVEELVSTVVFTPKYRNPDALRGLEAFSHIWLIWGFSQVEQKDYSPTVRPPRLGGNARMGVFATRSPFRPNPLGLSCVRLREVQLHTPNGPLLHLLGADLMDGTPIYDIKPYLPYTDSRPDATGGFAHNAPAPTLQVQADEQLLAPLPLQNRQALLAVLAQDPRPPYQNDPQRVYGMAFGGFEVKFSVDEDVLTVHSILPC